MSDTVADMTRVELQEMIASVVERTLIDLIGDPDTGLELTPEWRGRLLEQQRAVATGTRGTTLEAVEAKLGLR
jgi:hypothetical protein